MMATKTYRAKKTLLAFGVLLASGLTVSQAQADQLADIKAAGRRLAPSMPKRIRLSATTSILPKRWPNLLV